MFHIRQDQNRTWTVTVIVTNPAAEAASLSSPACCAGVLQNWPYLPLKNIYSPQRQDTRCLFSLKKINPKITLKMYSGRLEMTNTKNSLSQIRGFFRRLPGRDTKQNTPKGLWIKEQQGTTSFLIEHKRSQGFYFEN